MKPSPALATLLHILWGGLFGLIVSGGAAIVQYNTTYGINIPQDAIVFSLAVLTGMGSAAISTWNNIRQSPALPIVESEATSVLAANANTLAQQAHMRLDGVITWLNNHSQYHAGLAPAPQPQQPLTGPAVSRAVTTPAARPPQAIPFPPPTANTAPHVSFGDTGMTPVVPPSV